MLVLIAGMPRSGSTLSFNIAKEILKKTGSTEWITSNSTENSILSCRSKNLLIKNHNIDNLAASLIKTDAMKAICTIRDLFEAMESWMEVFGFQFDETIEAFKKWAETFQSIKSYALLIDFNDIENNLVLVIEKISAYLDISLSALEVSDILKKYNKNLIGTFVNKLQLDSASVKDIGFSYYDEETFFHRNNVRNQNKMKLNQLQKDHIRKLLAEFSIFSY